MPNRLGTPDDNFYINYIYHILTIAYHWFGFHPQFIIFYTWYYYHGNIIRPTKIKACRSITNLHLLYYLAV